MPFRTSKLAVSRPVRGAYITLSLESAQFDGRMRLLGCLILALMLNLVAAGSCFAQLGAIADLDAGWTHYQAGQYSEAVQKFDQFLKDYGTDPSLESAIQRVNYLRALSFIKLEQWPAATVAIDQFLTGPGAVNPAWSAELAFWKGVGLLNQGQGEEGRKSMLSYLANSPESTKQMPGILLVGSSFSKEEKHSEAAMHYKEMQSVVSPLEAGQLILMELDALLQAGDNAAATATVKRGVAAMDDITQITAFQLLALDLAEKLIDAGDERSAVALLLGIEPRAAVLTLQKERLAKLGAAIVPPPEQSAGPRSQTGAAAKPQPEPAEPAVSGPIELLRQRIENDVAKLEALENFDALVRFRLASAFLKMERYYELAHVLDGMLTDLPPDPIVETASDTLIRSYMQIGQWDKVVETARIFADKFPKSAALPGVMLMGAQGLQEQQKLDEADAAFTEMLERFPDHSLAAEAAFRRAFNAVLREQYEEAVAQFAAVANDFPDDPVAEKSLFWVAEAESMRKSPEAAVAAAEAYLEKYPDGPSAADARYRKAFSLHALRDYENSQPLLEDFVANNPENPFRGEAMLLQADALLVTGKIDDGVAILESVPPGSYGEEAQFRIGKVYRLADEVEKLREHFLRYISENDQSARLAEAVYWVGWSWQDDPEKRNAVYWDAVEKFGNDEGQWGMTDILQGVIKSNRGDPESTALRDDLRERLTDARRLKKRALEVNLAWGLAQLLAKSDPDQSRKALVEVADRLDPTKDNPQIMIDVADALREDDRRVEAANLYADIRRWNPTSPFNDRVFAVLGLMAMEDGQPGKAVGYFERFERESPSSSLRSEILYATAEALAEEGRPDAALDKINSLLQLSAAPKRLKARALVKMGQIEMARGDYRKAVAPLQRVYVLYGGFVESAGRAYLETGRALAKLDDSLGAARTWLELLDQKQLAVDENKPLIEEARELLGQLPAAVRSQAEEMNRAAGEAAATAAAGGPPSK